MYSTQSGRRGRPRAKSSSEQAFSPYQEDDENAEQNDAADVQSTEAVSADTAIDPVDHGADREADLLTKATEPVRGLRMR